MSLGTSQEWLDADQHVEAWHMRNSLRESAYANHMIQREKLQGYPTVSDVGMKQHPYDLNLRGRDETGAEWNVKEKE